MRSVFAPAKQRAKKVFSVYKEREREREREQPLFSVNNMSHSGSLLKTGRNQCSSSSENLLCLEDMCYIEAFKSSFSRFSVLKGLFFLPRERESEGEKLVTPLGLGFARVCGVISLISSELCDLYRIDHEDKWGNKI